MTQYYLGVKIIMAWPEERDGKPGYAVRYEDGYQSWSPKETFERAYYPMGNQQDHVTQEMVDGFIDKILGETLYGGKTTLVTGTLKTGFEMIESSSCVDPDNYNLAIGTDIGEKRIKDRLWELLGFVLQWGAFGLRP